MQQIFRADFLNFIFKETRIMRIITRRTNIDLNSRGDRYILGYPIPIFPTTNVNVHSNEGLYDWRRAIHLS